MYQLFVLSQERAKKSSVSIPHLSIVICQPGDEPITLPKNALRVETLVLKFHDIGRGLKHNQTDFTLKYLEKYKIPPVYFTEEHARQVADLLERNPEIKTIIVNCEAGISRSSGVAAAISMAKNGDDASWFNNFRYDPNYLVYKILLPALGYDMPVDEDKFDPNRLGTIGPDTIF